MNDNADTNPAPPSRRSNEQNHYSNGAPNGNSHIVMPESSPHLNGHSRKPKIDAWLVLDTLLQRWHWLFLGGCIFASCFFLLASNFIRPKYTASAQLLRYEAGGKSDYFKTTPLSGDTFAALIKAPELLQSVCEKAA